MLQEELWISRLAKSANIAYETSETLWHAFMAQLEQTLSVDTAVDLEELGYWSLTLRQELVASIAGSPYLLPPRLYLSINTEPLGHLQSIIGIEELKHRLTLHSEARPQHIQAWLQSIPQTIREQLEAGRELHCSGLGRFVPIEGGYELELSEGFAEQINKPFGVFAPVELSPEMDSSELEHISLESLSALQHPPISHLYPTPEPQEQSSRQEPEQSGEPAPEQEPREDAPAESTEPAEAPTTSIDEKLESLSPAPPPSRKWLRLGSIIVWGFAIGVFIGVALIIYLSRRDASNIELQTEAVAVSTAQEAEHSTESTPTLPPTKEALMAQDSLLHALPYEEYERIVRLYELPEVGKYALREQITLKPGASLMRISRAKYGHDVFWVYIYEANKERMPNPKVALVGTSLELPEARRYGIDPNDTKALEKALEIQRRLFK